MDTSMSADSDDRSTLQVGTTLRRPLDGPIDLELRVGQLRVQEGAAALQGTQILGRGTWAVRRHVDASGWARHGSLGDGSVNGGADLRLHGDRHALTLGAAREDVETVAGIRGGIANVSGSGSYAYQSPGWRAEASAARRAFNDGNWRNELHASVLRRFGARSRWSAGGSVGYQDSAFEPAAYWAPVDLAEGFARLTFRELFDDASTLSADVRVGAGRDADSQLRPAGVAQVLYSRWWGSGPRLRTAIALRGRATPSYRSTDASFELEARF
jgi:hypothetical protein